MISENKLELRNEVRELEAVIKQAVVILAEHTR